jgi:hypothetical protein
MALGFAETLAGYVRGYLDQDENTIPDSTFEVFVRAVEGHLNRALRDHPRMRAVRSWPLQAGDNEIPIPSDMLQLIAVKRNGVALMQYPTTMESTAALSEDGAFVNYGNCIKVWPAPSEAEDVSLEMSIALLSLVDPSQVTENWVSRYHNDIYQQGLLAEAAGYLRDRENQQLWTGIFRASLEDLRLQGWDEPFALGVASRA